MRILILGGTGFAGRILTEKLTQTDNEITLFNRGKTNPSIFPEVKHITGDRNTGDIKKIAGNNWDVIVDFSGMYPGNIDEITELLKGKTGRYIFISSGSAYPLEDPSKLKIPVNEDADTLPCTEEQAKEKDIMAAYGNKKAECERILLGKDWLDAIIFRPALIYGRYDPTDRFYYWLYRVKTQDEILIPGKGSFKFTHTFSEDYADILFKAIGIKNHRKVYNAVTHDPVSLKEFLDISSREAGREPKYVSASADFLHENEVYEWAGLPLWLTGFDMIFDSTRLKNDFTPDLTGFEGSVKKTMSYYDSLGWKEGKYGLRIEKEKELIKKLKTNKSG
jgi:2'-hydroxyisoflavone reductase